MKKIGFLLTTLYCFYTVQAQLNIEFLGQLEYSSQLANLTGWADGAGNEYAIVGTEDGTSIVDITDPTDPVEVQFIDGVNSIWREVRTWEQYAYVVTEGGGGLLCIDLSGLPGSVETNFTDGGVGLSSGHTVFCDENGFVHVFGGNTSGGGDAIFDANVDPMNPVFVGEVDTWYIHDGYVRGDTLWAGNIYEGQFSVWDLSDKSSPELLATQNTPDNFTHNTWLTDDGNYLFTTDEVTNATVASYDVSDLTDIKELDQFRANPGTNSIPHNTFVFGNFLVTAYYTDGVVITDATYPDIMIKTGEYDTSPFSGSGFSGAWGCWPYLPSGNIIVSDMQEGLFILGPTYVQACYVEGDVTDASSGANIFGATVEIVASSASTSTDITGHYATGLAEEGLYDITFSKTGYSSETVTGVSLTSGDIVTVDVELEPLSSYVFSGQVVDALTGTGVANAAVFVQGETISYETTADVSGNFSFSAIYEDTYDVFGGKWGYMTTEEPDYAFSSGDVLTLYVNKGYYDDFILDFNWDASDDGASSGFWVRDVPIGTELSGVSANPGEDVDGDFGNKCYVTGNEGGSAGDDDVDNGHVFLESPVFDMSTYSNPHISFYYWFDNDGGSGTPNDVLTISISNGSSAEVLVEVDNSLVEEGEWLFFEGDILDYISLSSNMQLIVETGDDEPGHICEAAIDKFYIVDETAAPVAAFEADNVSGCEPFSVHYTDMSDNAPTSWAWTFEGGTPASSTSANPTIEYTTPGTYDVSLIATNSLGSNSISMPDYITIYDTPDILTSTGAGTATVVISGGTAPFDILWDDAAGQTTETATGLGIGTYNVTVTDANGCSATASANVQTVSVENILPGFFAQLYPNPVADQLIIYVEYKNANDMMLVMEDIAGRKVFEKNITTGENSISVSEVSAGMYSITLLVDGKIASVSSIVKQ
ncbi:MAG: choice-of-anchor B family protein [Chitinophagales bacterium]